VRFGIVLATRGQLISQGLAGSSLDTGRAAQQVCASAPPSMTRPRAAHASALMRNVAETRVFSLDHAQWPVHGKERSMDRMQTRLAAMAGATLGMTTMAFAGPYAPAAGEA